MSRCPVAACIPEHLLDESGPCMKERRCNSHALLATSSSATSGWYQCIFRGGYDDTTLLGDQFLVCRRQITNEGAWLVNENGTFCRNADSQALSETTAAPIFSHRSTTTAVFFAEAWILATCTWKCKNPIVGHLGLMYHMLLESLLSGFSFTTLR